MNPKYTFMDRKRFYEEEFPHFPPCLIATPTRLDGLWQIGNDYRNKSRYYGAFPASFLRRVFALFPDRQRVLMLFSGSVGGDLGYTTFDINPELKPDVVGDAERLPEHFKAGAFDLVISDPPYSVADAVRYQTKMVDRRKVTTGVAHVLEPGGFCVWLDTVWPMHRKTEMRSCGVIGLVRSTNHRIRGVSLFHRQ